MFLQPHELDLCRFDITVSDCTWCLRAETEEDKQNWVDVLEGFRVSTHYIIGICDILVGE